MLDIEIFAFLGRYCRQSTFTLLISMSILTGRLLNYSEHLIWDIQIYALLVETNLFPKLFDYLIFSHRISIGSFQMFLFSLKVTNFYRKSFGDDLLPMVAHGTNGDQWLPSASVGCHRSPSVGITFYRWLPMGELRTHQL